MTVELMKNKQIFAAKIFMNINIMCTQNYSIFYVEGWQE